ncbi:MAG: hypothetical protein KGH75_05040 [Rhodospirillales bacterium]|nr:hypothetical protein [Rhodospirillales bacterium]
MNSEPQEVVRRISKAGCAPLLALPAALSLNAPALAQTVINTSQTGSLSLDGLAGPVEIATGVSITAAGGAAVSANLPTQFTNAGQVQDSAGIGIALGGGGSVANSGLINASSYGVRAAGVAATVINSGQIGAGDDGISLNRGGVVTNTGSIFGAHIGVYTGNGLGVVQNSGTISARNGDAVSLYSGGSLTNAAGGELLGGYSGVYAGGNGSSITNAGLISGPLFGVYLMGDSTITNSGIIAGGTDGIIDIGQGGTVVNSGVIHGGQAGVQFNKGGRLSNAGTITGLTGVVVNAGAVINNAGTITATAGGNAISLRGGASRVTLETGSVVNGAIAANGTASTINLAGHGSLSGDITGLQAGQVNILQNAMWTVSGNWQAGQVVNAGTLTAGLVGTPLTIQGDYTQTSTGTLRVVVTPLGMSHLAVTGTAHLAGTLAYVLSPGTYQPGSYSFLTAAGGVSGDFSTVQVSDAAQHSRLPAGAVTITASQTPVVSVAPPALVLAVRQTVVVAPPDGAVFANAGQVLALAGAASGQALLARADGQSGAPCTAPAPAGPQAGQAANVVSALASGFCGMGGWMQATGSDISTDGAYNARGGGFLAGLDRAVGAGRLGLAVGYDVLNLKDEAGGKAFLGTMRLGLYGGINWGPAALSAELMDGLVNTGTTRATGAGWAAANGHGNVLSAALQAAFPIAAWGGAFRPAAGLEITRYALGGLNEAAAAQPLAVKTASASGIYVAPYLRLNASRNFITGQGFYVSPNATIGLTVNAINPGVSVGMTAQDGTAFSVAPPHLAPVAGEAVLGLAIGRGNWRLSVRYNAMLAGNWHAQSLQGGLLLRF